MPLASFRAFFLGKRVGFEPSNLLTTGDKQTSQPYQANVSSKFSVVKKIFNPFSEHLAALHKWFDKLFHSLKKLGYQGFELLTQRLGH